MKQQRTAIVFFRRKEQRVDTRFYPTDSAAKREAMIAADKGYEVYAFKAMYIKETKTYKDIGQIFWSEGDC